MLLFHDSLSPSPPQSIKDTMIGEWWDENNLQIVVAFAWGNWEKSQKTWLKVDGIPVKIWTGHFPNTSLECYNTPTCLVMEEEEEQQKSMIIMIMMMISLGFYVLVITHLKSV